MAYSEIINEIQEQIDEINLHIEETTLDIQAKQAELAELEEKLPQFAQQLAGLQDLKANAQALIDSVGEHNINLNINVSTSGNTVFTGSTEVWPFRILTEICEA